MRLIARLTSGLTLCVLGTALTVGCESSGRKSGDGSGILRAGLPPSATVVTEGAGQITYTPEEAGQVYLYDMTQERVIGRFQMRRGQRLAMDGVAGRATIDGNEVRIGDTKKNGNYQVYFLGDPVE